MTLTSRDIATAFHRATRVLTRPSPSLVAALVRETGLSAPMIRWALRDELGAFDRVSVERLADLGARASTVGARALVVLAGNVFTTPATALFYPLIAGREVTVKPSTQARVFVRTLVDELFRVEPRLRDRLALMGASRARATAALREFDEVIVYGADETIETVRGALAPPQRLIPHGHGCGVVWVSARALVDGTRRAGLARGVAFDVAAYDQSGCLSPQLLVIEDGNERVAARFAEDISRELARLERRLPRGVVDRATREAIVRFRDIAVAVGAHIAETATSLVTAEGEAPIRSAPGARTLPIVTRDRAGVCALLRQLGPHLKTLGHASKRIPPGIRDAVGGARTTSVGLMQRPTLDEVRDGEHPLRAFDVFT